MVIRFSVGLCKIEVKKYLKFTITSSLIRKPLRELLEQNNEKSLVMSEICRIFATNYGLLTIEATYTIHLFIN